MAFTRKTRLPLVLLAVAVLAATFMAGRAVAGFANTTDNPGNSVTAATDFRAPTVSATVIAKTTGYVDSFIKQNGTYRVYANVTDTGNPASGVNTVTANVSNITAGQTAAALSSGSFSYGGVSYNYRSAQLTADNPLSAGSKSYTLTETDNASNSGTTNGSVTVDNTAPTASDVQATNDSGGTVGKAEQNDKVTFTFSEPMDPDSIFSGWTGSSTNVTVRISHNLNLLGLGSRDHLRVYDSSNSSQIATLGAVDLGRSDYVAGVTCALGGNIYFGASGTASTMVMSGSTVTVTLGNGTADLLCSAGTAAGTGTMNWGSSTSPYDRAANAATGNTATESGSADKEF
jgi:hypothetical protein